MARRSLRPWQARMVSAAGLFAFRFNRLWSGNRYDLAYADRTGRVGASVTVLGSLLLACLFLASVPSQIGRALPAQTTIGRLDAGDLGESQFVSFRGIPTAGSLVESRLPETCYTCLAVKVLDPLNRDRWILVESDGELGDPGREIPISGYVHYSGGGVWIEHVDPNLGGVLAAGLGLLLGLFGLVYAVGYWFPYVGFVPAWRRGLLTLTDEPLPPGALPLRLTGRFSAGPAAPNARLGLRERRAMLWRAAEWRVEEQRRAAFGVASEGAEEQIATGMPPLRGGDMLLRDTQNRFTIALPLEMIDRLEAGEVHARRTAEPAVRLWLDGGTVNPGSGHVASRLLGSRRVAVLGVDSAEVRDALFRGIVAQAGLQSIAPGYAVRRPTAVLPD